MFINLKKVTYLITIQLKNMKQNLLKLRKRIMTACLLFVIGASVSAQSVGVGTTTPDASAKLDVFSSNKGVLLPRVSLASIKDAAAVTSPETGLTLWNTNEAIIGGKGIGLYGNFLTKDLPLWLKLVNSQDLDSVAAAGWLLKGNTGTNAIDNFLGTTDDQDLVVRREMVEGFRLTKGGALLITGDINTGIVPVSGAGARTMWIPNKQAFRTGAVDGEQWDVIGAGSFAAGINPMATGFSSIAIGNATSATNSWAVAIGNNSTASGSSAIAIGANSTASANRSMALGTSVNASAEYSTAMGFNTTASADGATAMGNYTTVSGSGAFAMGYGSIASGSNSAAMGNNTEAIGQNSTAMGSNTEAIGQNSLATGLNTKAEIANSTAMGNGTHANGQSAVAMGSLTTASNDNATAMGLSTIASGKAATAMGEATLASGNNSTAMGLLTKATADRSTAMGDFTTAGAANATAMGNATTAGAINATATGLNTTASGNNSFAMGEGTFTQANSALVAGRFNTVAIQDPAVITATDKVFVVGNGLDGSNRNDAFVVERSGRTGVNISTPTALLTLKGKTFGANAWTKHIRLVDEASSAFSAMIYDNEGTKFRNFSINNEFTFRDVTDAVLARIKANGDMVTAGGIATGGTLTVGATGTAITNVIKVTTPFDLPNIAAGAAFVQPLMIANAEIGSTVYCSPNTALPAGVIIAWARVVALGQVDIAFQNVSANPVNPNNMSFHITVIK
jgi:hypothetical protein